MKIISWNVNGYRAVLGKGFLDWLNGCGADVVCLQETKCEPDQLAPEEREPQGWKSWWSASKVKKGHSGVACFSRVEPLAVSEDLPDAPFQGEGRVLRLEFPAFHLFNVYFPNSGMGPERLAYKLGFYDAFLRHCDELRAAKPVLAGGDFNVAHKPIDLKNPEKNEKSPGYLPEERALLDRMVADGWVDTFRLFDPAPERYTWWPYFRPGARARNSGWRIDYFFCSSPLVPSVRAAWIAPEVMGSDHCPVGVEIGVEIGA